MHIRHMIAGLAGAGAALLAARLLLRLLAARPDNPVFALFLAATSPPPALAAVLDAGQPRLGATLEFSTLALVLLLLALALVLSSGAGRANRRNK